MIRGCYRRMAGGTIGGHDTLDNEVDLFESDLEPGPVPKSLKRVRRNETNRNQKTSCPRVETFASSEGEHFDLDVSSTEESG